MPKQAGITLHVRSVSKVSPDDHQHTRPITPGEVNVQIGSQTGEQCQPDDHLVRRSMLADNSESTKQCHSHHGAGASVPACRGGEENCWKEIGQNANGNGGAGPGLEQLYGETSAMGTCRIRPAGVEKNVRLSCLRFLEFGSLMMLRLCWGEDCMLVHLPKPMAHVFKLIRQNE